MAGSSRSFPADTTTGRSPGRVDGCLSPSASFGASGSTSPTAAHGSAADNCARGSSTTRSIDGTTKLASGSGRCAGHSTTPSSGRSSRRGFLPHDLRHRRITKWLAEGKSAVLVKEAVGHADLRTTMGYTHLAKEHLRSLVVGEPTLDGLVQDAG